MGTFGRRLAASRIGPINKNSQQSAPTRSQELDLDDLDAFRIGYSLGDFLDLCHNLFFSENRHRTSIYSVFCNKKVGFRPLVTSDNSIIHV